MRPAGHSVAFPPDSLANGHGRHTRDGRPVEIFNLRYLPKWWPAGGQGGQDGPAAAEAAAEGSQRDVAGGMLLAAVSALLAGLAAAQGYVSFRAQYAFVHAIKGEHEQAASFLEALGLDTGAVIFALLALAQARLGRNAVVERALNLACVAGSLAMNALSADMTSAKSIAAWTLPAALYAACSDRLIAVVRRRALARMPGARQDASPLAAALRAVLGVAGGVGLWLLRLLVAFPSTLSGFRGWVVETAPVAPGRRAAPKVVDLSTFTGFGRWTVDPATNPAIEAATQLDTPDNHPDSRAAIEADTQADTADSAADNVRPIRRSRRPATATVSRHRPAKSASGADSKAAMARTLLAAQPDMTGAELGRRLGVSERTGRRYVDRLSGQITQGQNTTDDAAGAADGGQQ